tara:strand:+ start:252 stop:878 length:627 start_codon:yes stop_codon:yes gene_type:complete
MGKKKKRIKLLSIYATIEGAIREKNLLNHLKNHYHDESKVKLNISPIHGGTPDRLLDDAFKRLHHGYDRIFVWLDEDIDISGPSRNRLFSEWRVPEEHQEAFMDCPLGQLQSTYNNTSMRKPVLVASNPVCVESLILRALGKTPCHSSLDLAKVAQQRQDLKNSLDGVFGRADELEYYDAHLDKTKLEAARKEIPELDLLISLITTKR